MNLEDVLLIGTRAAQPAATAVAEGMLYSITDENNLVEQSRGGVWVTYAGVGAGSSSSSSSGVSFPLPIDGEDGLDGFMGPSGLPGPAGAAGAAGGGGSGAMPPIFFKPTNNEPPVTNFATIDTRNSHPTLDFDDTTDEEAIFSGFLPIAYAGGGLVIETFWICVAVTGNFVVDATIERMNTDIDADSFVAVQSATGAANATSGIIIQVDIPFTDGAQMDGLLAGEMFRLKIRRDADNVSDTLVGDAELLGVVVRET